MRFFLTYWTSDVVFYGIDRDRHAFSELDSSIGKTLQKRFRIEICAIKNPIVKKNRIKNGFSYPKIALEKEAKCPVLFKGKMSKKRPFVF